MTIKAWDDRRAGVIAEVVVRNLAEAAEAMAALAESLRRRGIDPASVPIVVEGDVVHVQAIKDRPTAKDTYVTLGSPALQAMRKLAA